MRVLILCALLAASLGILPAVAEEDKKAKGPYDRVATGKRPAKDDVKVYTNADLKKLSAGVAEADDEAKPDTEPAAEGEKPAAKPDPLAWLQEQQAARAQQAENRQKAQDNLVAARERLANLEKQLLAARNPFSARPELSEDEKKIRAESGETAAERYERTQKLVEEAREAVRAAEAEVARLRNQQP